MEVAIFYSNLVLISCNLVVSFIEHGVPVVQVNYGQLLSINRALTEQLDHYGFRDVISGLRDLTERGKIEFTATPCINLILALIPGQDVVRRIEFNTGANRHYFGDVYHPFL